MRPIDEVERQIEIQVAWLTTADTARRACSNGFIYAASSRSEEREPEPEREAAPPSAPASPNAKTNAKTNADNGNVVFIRQSSCFA